MGEAKRRRDLGLKPRDDKNWKTVKIPKYKLYNTDRQLKLKLLELLKNRMPHNF